MKITRKDFLLLSGLTLASVAGEKAVRALSDSAESSIPPVKAKRWGMVVDLGKCRKESGCKDCIQACNQAHNIPQIPDPAREVKWIWTEPFEVVFPQAQTDYTRQGYAGTPTPVMCNHCGSPACTRVCPTKATWKRPEDGIVMMDFHRCIGCKYCMVACPYGARSFNFMSPRPYLKQINADFPTRAEGVVEKCNFCAERVSAGKQPVCVGTCPEQALTFGDLEDANSAIRLLLRSRFSSQRRPEMGTQPNLFYLV